MAHRTGAVALLLLLAVPPSAIAQSEQSAPPAHQAENFERWIDGPVRYLVTEREQQIGEGLSGSGEFAAFRHWFWQRRDPVPGTLVNEFHEQFDARVEYVNKTFANAVSGTPGWRTSKGVVYILLGPPTRRGGSVAHLYRRTGDLAVEWWVYEFDDASVLELPFIAIDGGFTLLRAPNNASLQKRLDLALRRAAEASVQDRELRFTGVHSLPPDADAASTWPGTATVACADDAIDAEISIPLTRLYGQREGNGLRVQLDFQAGLAGGAPVDAGGVSVLLRPALFERPEAVLMLVLWLPGADCAERSSIDIREAASGRVLHLDVIESTEQIATVYPVHDFLASDALLDGTGAVVAFVRGDDAQESSWAARLLRGPEDSGNVVIEHPAPGLWLVQNAPR